MVYKFIISFIFLNSALSCSQSNQSKFEKFLKITSSGINVECLSCKKLFQHFDNVNDNYTQATDHLYGACFEAKALEKLLPPPNIILTGAVEDLKNRKECCDKAREKKTHEH